MYLSNYKKSKDTRYIVAESTYTVDGSVRIDRKKLPRAVHGIQKGERVLS